MWQLLFFMIVFVDAGISQVAPENFFYTFDPKGSPVANVEIYNHYTDRAVKVEIESNYVTKPGEKDEKLDPKRGLIVSPKSFSLEPKSSRTIRLLLKNRPKDIEDVYRVTFSPKSFTGTPEYIEKNKDKKGINLAVLVGSGMLIFAPPLNGNTAIEWSKKGNEFVFTNTGNKHVMLTFCEAKQKCSDSNKGGRLYAGKQISYAPKGKGFKLQKELLNGEVEEVIISSDTGKHQFKR